MGVDTKAIINPTVTLDQIKEVLKKNFGEVKIHDTSMSYFFHASFQNGEENRSLNIFFPEDGDTPENTENGDPFGITLMLGCWGESVKIMNILLDEFGGFIDENDCDEIDFEPRNLEKYKEKFPQSKEALFRWELTKIVGIEKVDKVLELFSKI